MIFNKILSFCLILLCVNLLTSCAFSNDKIYVEYQPQFEACPILEAQDVCLDVRVVDNRSDKKHVGYLGCGTESLSIILENDLENVIYEGIKQEFENRGFTILDSSIIVEAEIHKFNNEFRAGFLSGAGIAELIMTAYIKNAHGQLFYSKTIIGTYRKDSIYLAMGKNAKIALQGALYDTIRQLFADEAFLNTLIEMSASLNERHR